MSGIYPFPAGVSGVTGPWTNSRALLAINFPSLGYRLAFVSQWDNCCTLGRHGSCMVGHTPSPLVEVVEVPENLDVCSACVTSTPSHPCSTRNILDSYRTSWGCKACSVTTVHCIFIISIHWRSYTPIDNHLWAQSCNHAPRVDLDLWCCSLAWEYCTHLWIPCDHRYSARTGQYLALRCEQSVRRRTDCWLRSHTIRHLTSTLPIMCTYDIATWWVVAGRYFWSNTRTTVAPFVWIDSPGFYVRMYELRLLIGSLELSRDNDMPSWT